MFNLIQHSYWITHTSLYFSLTVLYFLYCKCAHIALHWFWILCESLFISISCINKCVISYSTLLILNPSLININQLKHQFIYSCALWTRGLVFTSILTHSFVHAACLSRLQLSSCNFHNRGVLSILISSIPVWWKRIRGIFYLYNYCMICILVQIMYWVLLQEEILVHIAFIFF